MRITATSDYALRATVALAGLEPDAYLKAERLSSRERIPLEYLEKILGELRRAGLVAARRGADGGYRLARAADTIGVGDVLTAVGSALAPDADTVMGDDAVSRVWHALDTSTRTIVEQTTIADVVAGRLPTA